MKLVALLNAATVGD